MSRHFRAFYSLFLRHFKEYSGILRHFKALFEALGAFLGLFKAFQWLFKTLQGWLLGVSLQTFLGFLRLP